MQRTGFEKLKVYQLSEVLSDRLWECVCEWGHLAQRTVGEQLIRAADSVGANIAEGYGRGTCNDNRRFVRIARGSLYETKHFLRRAYRRKLIADEDVDAIKVLIEELTPKLNAYLNSIGSRTTNNQQPTTNKVPQ